MVDSKRLDELCQSLPVHGMQWQLPTGKWNTSVVEIIDSSTASGTDETTLVLRFEIASDDTGGQQDKLQRYLTLTFADFKYIRDIPTAMRYAESLHGAILEFLQSDTSTETGRI